MFGVMVANVLHRRAHVRQASMEQMRSLPSLRALERRASMLIRMKNIIWQRPIHSKEGVSYWACAMAPWPKIRFSGFGYWKAPLLPLRPLRKDFSNELGHTYVEALTVLGCQKNGHAHGYGNFRAPWHPGVDMFQIKPASMEQMRSVPSLSALARRASMLINKMISDHHHGASISWVLVRSHRPPWLRSFHHAF